MDRLIHVAQEIIQDQLGLRTQDSRYFIHDDNVWAGENGDGFFLPRTLSAHLRCGSEFLLQNLFHEYFGHGIYCEHSSYGRQLVSLDRALDRAEREAVTDRPVRFDSRKRNLEAFLKNTIHINEGFAMWMEHFCSNATGTMNDFERKYSKLHDDYKKAFELFKTMEDDYGRGILLYASGFPKVYTEKKVGDILRRVFKKDFNSIELALLYGSQKPYSDIDIFVVSNNIRSMNNGWLDVFAVTPSELRQAISLLDIAITTPLTTGTLVVGQQDALDTLRQKLLQTPITQEATIHNMKRSDEEFQLAVTQPEESPYRRIGLGYKHTYQRNAEELQKGKKVLALSNPIQKKESTLFVPFLS